MRSVLEIQAAAKEMRKDILRLSLHAGKKGAHIAPSLSTVEMMAALFLGVLDRDDVFVLSKGHGGLCYYAAMAQANLITRAQLDSFEENGGDFPGQPSRSGGNGIVFSSGSLGMGLSYGVGVALSKRMKAERGRVFVLLGDGELNEGSVWEAAMLAKQKRLNNIVAIVDRNNMQSDGFSKDILELDVAAAWSAFGWNTLAVDGHNAAELLRAYGQAADRPTAIIASTVKGKGVSFMENERVWHHASLTEEQYQRAIAEVMQ